MMLITLCVCLFVIHIHDHLQVVAAARTHVEQGADGEQLEFMTMRNGYRCVTSFIKWVVFE